MIGKRTLFALALAGSLLAGTATAQRLITLDNADCAEALATASGAVGAGLDSPEAPRKSVGRCEARMVRLSVDDVEISIDRMSWRPGSLDPLGRGALPDAVALTLSGVTVTPAVGSDEVLTYLLREQARGRGGFDAYLGLSFDADAGRVDLTRAELDFGNGNLIVLSGQLRGVSPGLPAKPQLALALVVEELNLDIGSYGLFEDLLLMPLGLSLLQGPEPEAEIETLKATADEMVRTGLAAALTPDAVRNLRALIADMPHPRGKVKLQARAPEGYALIRLGALARGTPPAELLDGVEISIDYDPAR